MSAGSEAGILVSEKDFEVVLAEEETSSAISHVVSYCPKPIGFSGLARNRRFRSDHLVSGRRKILRDKLRDR